MVFSGFFEAPPTTPAVSPHGLSDFGSNYRDPPPKLQGIAGSPRGLRDFGKKDPPHPTNNNMKPYIVEYHCEESGGPYGFCPCSETLKTQIIDWKKKCFRTIRNMNKIRFLLSTEQRKQVVIPFLVSCLGYCNSLYYYGISGKLQIRFQLIQNACSMSITGKYKHDHLVPNDLKSLHCLINIKNRVLFKLKLLAYKAVNGFAPNTSKCCFPGGRAFPRYDLVELQCYTFTCYHMPYCHGF